MTVDHPGGLFNSLADQLERVRRWNHVRRWGFGARDFDGVDVTDVIHPNPLVVDVIALYLLDSASMNGVQRTCDELWKLVARDHPTSFSWDDG